MTTKLIKTVFRGIQEFVPIYFDGSYNYLHFLDSVKETYNVRNEVELELYNQNYMIKPQQFAIIVDQFINKVDFIIEIKEAVTQTEYVEIFIDGSQELQIPDTPSSQDTFDFSIAQVGINNTPQELLNSSSSYVAKANENKLLENNSNDLPSTQQIRQLHEIREALAVNNLENKHRINISKGIIFLILNTNPEKRLIREDFVQLAQSIVDIFPSELKETYYVPFTKGHLARGKLYDAYNNKRARLSAAGVIKRRPKYRPDESVVQKRLILDDDLGNFDESLLQLLQLENHSNWDLVLEHWEKSHKYRQKELQSDDLTTADYFCKYKVLSNIKNYELFQIDFKLLYPNSKSIYEWKNYYMAITKKSENLKDLKVQEILSYIKASDDEDSKVALSLLLIPYNLPNCRQQSKGEIQESFIFYCKNILTADNEIRARTKCLKIESQPKIYFIGDSKKIISMAYVEICGKRFKFKNPLQAVEVCLQCFITINIKYPKYSTHVWIFLQQTIFDVNTPWDVVIPSVKTLAKELSKN